METKILELAERGFSVRCISRHTGFTKNQVRYILVKNKQKLRDYREGRNDFSQTVIQKLKLPTLKYHGLRRAS